MDVVSGDTFSWLFSLFHIYFQGLHYRSTMGIVVIDTSLFTNPFYSQQFAERRLDAVHKILTKLHKCGFEVFMTPGCLAEVEGFIDDGKLDPSIMSRVRVRDPDLDNLKVRGTFVDELVKEFRLRGDAALKVACKQLVSAYKTHPKPRQPRLPDPVQPLISSLRTSVRQHLREGFLDSSVDWRVIVLAKQLDARLVTGDEGMKTFAKRLGVEYMPVSSLAHLPIPQLKTKSRKRKCMSDQNLVAKVPRVEEAPSTPTPNPQTSQEQEEEAQHRQS